jgi:hypothetical protein
MVSSKYILLVYHSNNISNWLKTPSEELFSVILRVYQPGEEFFSNLSRVDLPIIKKVSC